MAKLIDTWPAPAWRDPEDIDLFAEVVSSIISQQLSVKAADTIEARLYNLLSKKQLSPQNILNLDPEAMRACGISYAKIKYIQSAAHAALTKEVNFNNLTNLSDEDVVAELIKIHGVGKWTAEMLLIFSLQRPDIFSIGDLGLRTAVANLYSVERSDLPAIQSIAQSWAPYRSLASRYLWLSLNNAPSR